MTATIALVRAEQALLSAKDILDLEAKWFEHCAGFADESEERQYLLGIYHDIAARFAVEAFKYARAG
jgi:hypothetical protein